MSEVLTQPEAVETTASSNTISCIIVHDLETIMVRRLDTKDQFEISSSVIGSVWDAFDEEEMTFLKTLTQEDSGYIYEIPEETWERFLDLVEKANLYEPPVEDEFQYDSEDWENEEVERALDEAAETPESPSDPVEVFEPGSTTRFHLEPPPAADSRILDTTPLTPAQIETPTYVAPAPKEVEVISVEPMKAPEPSLDDKKKQFWALLEKGKAALKAKQAVPTPPTAPIRPTSYMVPIPAQMPPSPPWKELVKQAGAKSKALHEKVKSDVRTIQCAIVFYDIPDGHSAAEVREANALGNRLVPIATADNPSNLLWRHGYRINLSAWMIPLVRIDLLKPLFEEWDRINEETMAQCLPDEEPGLLEFYDFEIVERELEKIKLHARESIRKEIQRLHGSMIKRIDDAHKALTAALEGTRIPTARDQERARTGFLNRTKKAIEDSAERLNAVIESATLFDETENVDHLFEALRGAIQVQTERYFNQTN
jgi:hypothetical protein